ncbi:hypothetical protein ILT44_07725 [Microvirga sp. BT689]|uniref:hypothetical protein n=1 Tax=Microvirga arvi TaxID=2778731 RepID=UPI00195106CD|nr:hypothetical protein [Microvirga arvi]MBM6580064.1 hypothetical protein [Microvirga arvi]
MRPHRFPPSSFERLEPGEREIQIIPVQRINEAYERMLDSGVKYRFVIGWPP